MHTMRAKSIKLSRWKRKWFIHLERLTNRILSPVVSVSSKPVIILGNQKSGTTAIAALLAHLTGKSVTLDIEPLWRFPDLALFRKEIPFASFVTKNRYLFSRDIIKEPWLTFFYNDLRSIFPDAKYVFVIRDPRENIRSLLNRLKLPGDLEQLTWEDIQQLEPKWQIIFMGDLIGVPQGHYIEILAHRWVEAAKIYLKNQDNMILVQYESFELNKMKTIEQLAEQLGFEPKYSIKSLIHKPFQPPGNRKISLVDFFGEKNLKRIHKVCAEYMEIFHYIF